MSTSIFVYNIQQWPRDAPDSTFSTVFKQTFCWLRIMSPLSK